jgi:predicted nucleotidyltransferase
MEANAGDIFVRGGTLVGLNSGLQDILGEVRRRLEKAYGRRLQAVVLYGSQARGEAGPQADVDLLVVLDGPVDAPTEIARTEHDIAEISLSNNVVVSCVFVSRDQYEGERSPLLINIRREGVAV